MITITLTGDDAVTYMSWKANEDRITDLEDKLHKALNANSALTMRLASAPTQSSPRPDISKAQDIKSQESKRLMDDIAKESPFHKKEKKVVHVRDTKNPVEPAPWPLEPFMRDLILGAVGKKTAKFTTKYLADRSRFSMTTFRKAVKILGLRAKGGHIVKN